MRHLDHDLLVDLGIEGLAVAEEAAFLAEFRAELEMRVGGDLCDLLDPEEDEEFERLRFDDPEVVGSWLEKTIPTYRDIVAAAMDELCAEVRAGAAAVIEAARERPWPE